MIFVILGTSKLDFSRLAKAADEYAAQTSERVFIQLGYTRFKPRNAQYTGFLEKFDMLAKIREADIVVTQGGFGSIVDCMRMHKKMVAVPRKISLKEAPDDQEELVRELESLGHLIGVYNVGELASAISDARKRDFNPPPGNTIPRLVKEFIQKSQ